MDTSIVLAGAGFDFGADAGVGQENIEADDVTLPRLKLLQDKSPYIKKAHEKYIEGAEAGKFLLTVPELLLDEVTCAVAHVERFFIEAIPYDQGGGYKGNLDVDDPYVLQCIARRGKKGKFGHIPTDRGTQLTETARLYAVAVIEGELYSFTTDVQSFGLGALRDWRSKTLRYEHRTAAGAVQVVPLYGHLVAMTPALTKKETFYISITPENSTISESILSGGALYEAARKLNKLVAGGEVAVIGDDEDIPF